MNFLIIIWCFHTVSATDIVTIDPKNVLVKWQGWGTTMEFWGDLVGRMSQPVQDNILHHLFSPDNLNLNVLRYTIGATTPGDTTCGPFVPGGATESFRDGSAKPYNWARDPRARKVLLAAKQLGADTFEAVSRSPPSRMTRSKCSRGNAAGAPLHDNLDPIYSYAFADYLTEVVKHYHDTYNLSFSSIAPFYEPSSGMYKNSIAIEGCNMERSTMSSVIRSLDHYLKNKNLTFCTIAAADEYNIEQEIITQKYFTDHSVAQLYRKENIHWFSSSTKEINSELVSLADKNNHTIWISSKQFAGTSLPNMAQGVALAKEIVQDIKTLKPTAWSNIYWEVVRDPSQQHIGPLVTIPYDSSNAVIQNVRLLSGYYVYKQFSKYIRKGYTFIGIEDSDSIAAYDKTSQNLVIVTVNSGASTIRKWFSLEEFATPENIRVYRTSSSEPHVETAQPQINVVEFRYDFPPESVTTFLIRTSVLQQTGNLIKNGDFETGNLVPWWIQYGLPPFNVINGEYVRNGDYSGHLDFTREKLALLQFVSAEQTRTYNLSAWCAATSMGTKFGVRINDNKLHEFAITPHIGYRLYTIYLHAVRGDVITVYMYSEKGNYEGFIDDVAMYFAPFPRI